MPQQLIVPLLLIAIRDYERSLTTVLVYLLCLVFTHVIATFAPAISAYPYFNLPPAVHGNILLGHEMPFVEHTLALRSGTPLNLDEGPLYGLTTFPSLHAATAVLFAWALFDVPYVKWGSLGLNVAMLLATPLHGSHYLIDVLAGMALTPPLIMLARCLVRRSFRLIA